MPTKLKQMKITVTPELEKAIHKARGKQSASNFVSDIVANALDVDNNIQHGGWRGTRQQRDAYSQWLSSQLLGDDGYDPLTDQDGEYSFEYWLENIYKGE